MVIFVKTPSTSTNAKKATHSVIDNVVKKLLVLTSKILNDFSPAGVSKVALV